MLTDFEKEKVYWTRKMNLRLVEFMKSKPYIWNPKHPKYTSMKLRDLTYGQFAAMYDNQFSGQAVKERWTNIRSTFASYLRKVNHRKADEYSEPYHVRWHLWKACQFLLNVTKGMKNNKATSEVGEISTEEGGMDTTSDEGDLQCDENTTSTSCNDVAKDLVTVFRGLQNDAFGLDNSDNRKIGQCVSEKLSQMSSHDAAKLSVHIMELLLKYEERNSSID